MQSKVTISKIKSLLIIVLISSYNIVFSQSINYKDMMIDNSFNFYEVVDAANNYFEEMEGVKVQDLNNLSVGNQRMKVNISRQVIALM